MVYGTVESSHPTPNVTTGAWLHRRAADLGLCDGELDRTYDPQSHLVLQREHVV